VYELIRTKATAAINERTFYDNFKDSVIYIDSIPNPSSKSPVLENVFISDISDEDMVNIIYAKTGEFISAPDGGSTYLKLNNGELHTKSAGTKNYNIISFNSYLLHLKLGDESARQKHISSREMYPGALKKRIDDWERRRIPNSQLKIELHNRFSLPASVIVFAIIAIPLGIQRVRSPKLTGFALAIAVLIFNYILVKIFEVLGDNGLINHIVAAWAPNALLLIIGILALMSAAKDKQVKVIVWTEKNTVAIIKIFGKLAGIFIRKKHKRK
ncbi:MAG: LptF/LptG family permease, partial [Deltaproteobacteria bacterium]|nr:LptF/LptG family permease [Deltaproteobacteria bacterium]